MALNDELFRQLEKFECPDSTFRPKQNPIVLKRAKGSLIYDADGNRYIDLCAGFGALAFGHNPQYVLDILRSDKEEISLITHGLGDVYPSVDKIEFLTSLFSVLPPYLNKAALALTGSQAVELALKTAMLKTKKRSFLAFEGSYHGLDLGVLPLTHRKDFRAPFASFLCPDNTTHLPFGCNVSLIDRELDLAKKKSDGFAAMIVEPVQGRGGVRPALDGWLRDLREVCSKYGVLLIFDEVFTGFGRTGLITFSDQVTADLVCFGKAIGGGFPLSVCVGTDEVMSAWPICESEALHTGTFFGHPLSCRIATATIEEIKRTQIVKLSAAGGAQFRGLLKDQLADSPLIKDIRGAGMMTGIEFLDASKVSLLVDHLRKIGILAIPSGHCGSVLSITPALNIEMQLLEQATTLIKKAICLV